MRSNIFTLLLIAAIVLLLCVLFAERKSNGDSIDEAAKEVVKAEVEKVNKKIDREGFEHAVISDRENVVQSSSQIDVRLQRTIDSLAGQLEIKEKQLVHWLNYSVTLEAKLLEAERTDSSYRFTDRYTDIEFIAPKDSASNGYFNFKYNADIHYTEYWKRKHFLAAKKHYIDFWIADPRATVNGVKRVKFESKKPAVSLDVNASGYYTDRLNVGVDAGINIKRMRIGAGYFYDLEENKWRALMSAKFKILEF